VPYRVFRDSFDTTLVRQGRRVKVLIGKPEGKATQVPPNPINEAQRLKALLQEHGSLESVARAVGFTSARVSQLLGLLRLPGSIRQIVQDPHHGTPNTRFTERELRPIVVLKSPDQQLRAFSKLMKRKGVKAKMVNRPAKARAQDP
jgi:hypothetical protein